MANVEHGTAATMVKAQWTEDGRPQFEAGDFKEMEARSRGPGVLTPAEWAMVAEAKASGNSHFTAGEHDLALQQYAAALSIFSDRLGDHVQRAQKSVILANVAEVHLRLGRWSEAHKCSSGALKVDSSNNKARFRRARALTEMGDIEQLREAAAELDHLEAQGDALGKLEAQAMRLLIACPLPPS
jgi:tetratricopeptide (TPR) repeat protein